MSVVAAAIVTSTVVGAVGANAAAGRAASGEAGRLAFDYETLDYEKDQAKLKRTDYLEEKHYQRGQFAGDKARYDEIYGDVEKNLGDFYSALTPETFAAAGIEHEVKQYEQAGQRITESMAQRNLDSSGLVASVESQAELGHAERKANIRHEAPLKVAEAKAGFVASSGGRPGSPPRTGAAPGTSNVSNAMRSISNTMGRNAQADANRTSQAYSSVGNIIGTGLQLYSGGYGAPSAAGGSTSSAPLPTAAPYSTYDNGSDYADGNPY